jgi:membrane associated rhomboid family serine protease
MTTGPDLFVVCKSCGSEVSPYITECPYCGTRLRKRAPKIERDGTISEPRPAKRRRPSQVRLPGVPARAWGARPYATIVLLAASCFMWIALAWVPKGDLVIQAALTHEPLRLLSAAFVYGNGWYQLAVLTTLGVFGWLIERRHGPLPVVALFVLGGFGGLAVAALAGETPVDGANGAALALLAAWAMRDALAARRGEEIEGDLLGAAVMSAVVFLMPAATGEASWLAGGLGMAVGALAGIVLARVPEA